VTLHLRPVDLPLLRQEVLDRVTAEGPEVYEAAIRSGNQRARPLLPPPDAAGVLTREECGRLRSAELFYVAAPMLALATAAAESLPTFTLTPQDLPAPTGFLVFETPVLRHRRTAIAAPVDLAALAAEGGNEVNADEAVLISAICWGSWAGNWSGGGVWITWYAEVGSDQPAVAAEMRRKYGRVFIDQETQIPFTEDQPLHVGPDAFARATAIVKTIWLLMQQAVGEVASAPFDRATRRRMDRQKVEQSGVRVISLRRPVGAPSDGQGDHREWHHQWVVRGHWRRQWHPRVGLHRPTWIAPHIKGPEGAPMLGGEKVYNLQR